MKKLTLLFFILVAHFNYGQENDNKPVKIQPKIGVVLSGGGAKAFAHIGVLKIIEKTGLKIDYIGGTSMGAAIAALYATGYSAQQIDSIITSINFMDMLTDKKDRKYTSPFSKKNDEKYLLSLPIKNKKIGLPLAISKGQNTYNKLNELYQPVNHIQDFSKLPIPFFCIATNIETGKSVEINKGSLALAVRASASLPTLLTPCKIDSLTLIDGGISNNFPIDVMHNKNIDIIIGVDVQGILKKTNTIDSAIEVIDQIVNYQLYGEKDKKNIDIYIHPNVKDIGVVDFHRKRELIDAGEKKAKELLVALQKLSDQQIKQIEKTKISTKNKKHTIKNIQINGVKSYTHRYIKGKLNIDTDGLISISELGDRINYLTQTNNFNQIHYTFSEKDSLVNLELKLNENPQSVYLKFGAHYDTTYKLSGLVNFTQKKLFLRNDVLSVDLALGDNIRSNLNYFVDNGKFLSFGFFSRFNQLRAPSNSTISPELITLLNHLETITGVKNIDRLKVDTQYRDITNYIYTQTNYLKNVSISSGIEQKYIHNFTDAYGAIPYSNKTVFRDNHFTSLLTKIELDTYDKITFPTNGYLVNTSLRTYLASNNPKAKGTSQLRTTLEGIKTIHERVSIFLQIEGGFSYLTNKSNNMFEDYLNFELGGFGKNFINNFTSFHGYSYAELRGSSFLKTTTSLRFRFYKNNYIDLLANYALVTGNVIEFLTHKQFFTNAKTGYSLGYSTNSIIGPLEVRYAWSPENKYDALYLSAGFWF